MRKKVSFLVLALFAFVFISSCDVSQEKSSFTLSYRANRGDVTGTMDTVTVDTGDTVTLDANTFSLTGYTFEGWNTSSDGTGTSYDDEAAFTMGTVDVTLYAQWEVASYTLTFDKNNDSAAGTMSSVDLEYSEVSTLPSNTFSLTGYTLGGWNTSSDGTGTSYHDEAGFTMGTVDVTLYAQWEVASYTLTFDKNNDSAAGTMSSVDLDYEETTYLSFASGSIFTLSNHTLIGWNTSSDGNGTAYESGAAFTMGSADVTLYAQWSANIRDGRGMVKVGDSLYVASSNTSRILKVDPVTLIASEYAGTGDFDSVYDADGPDSFKFPWGMASNADGSVIYITEHDTSARRIRKLNIETADAPYMFGSDNFGSDLRGILAYNSTDFLLITDNGSLWMIRDGNGPVQIGLSGEAIQNAGEMVIYDSDVYVAGINGAVYKVEMSIDSTNFFGTHTGVVSEFLGSGRVSAPAGLLVDGTDLYISEWSAGKILKTDITNPQSLTEVASGISYPWAMVKDDTRVYVSGGNGVYTVDL
ncbi:MAG: InlB B-repeat-containing protein [Sphaerochaetaceae bacterium]|nr:InlB B-repeat-containing protein [Sphaerochaetaceae bacterium]